MNNATYLTTKQILLLSLLIPFIAANVFFGKRLHECAAQRTQIKENYGQINSFKNGLLSTDVWKGILTKIVTDRISDFKLTSDQRKILDKQTTKMLGGLLTEADSFVNKPKNGLGKIKTSFAKSYIKAARKNLPGFADAIDKQLRKPDTMQQLKEIALKQFTTYADATHSSSEDTANLNRLLAENNAPTIDAFNIAAAQKIKELDAQSFKYTLALLGSTLLFLLAWWLILKDQRLHRTFFGFSVVFAFVVLLTSLWVPMMEIDARIKSVDLMLIGEHVRFDEQVVYYRSKSLLQIVKVLMTSGKPESVGVGALILLFSILFPMVKLMASLLYLLGKEKIKHSKLINFFAFKSGKWSMADVTVVAIFMAYIGFESIIQTQLHNLDVHTNIMESITTDASSMQPGFILFTTFVLYSMALSEILKRIGAPESGATEENAGNSPILSSFRSETSHYKNKEPRKA